MIKVSDATMIAFIDNFFYKPVRKWGDITKNNKTVGFIPPIWWNGSDTFEIGGNYEIENIISNRNYNQTIKLISGICPQGVNCYIDSYNSNTRVATISCADRFVSKHRDGEITQYYFS